MAAEQDIPTPWIGIDELPVHFANAFGAAPAPNAVFLIFGSVMPLAEDDGKPYAPVRPIARMAIAPEAVPQLLATIEAAAEARKEPEEPEGA